MNDPKSSRTQCTPCRLLAQHAIRYVHHDDEDPLENISNRRKILMKHKLMIIHCIINFFYDNYVCLSLGFQLTFLFLLQVESLWRDVRGLNGGSVGRRSTGTKWDNQSIVFRISLSVFLIVFDELFIKIFIYLFQTNVIFLAMAKPQVFKIRS